MFNRIRAKRERARSKDDKNELTNQLHSAILSGSLKDVIAIVQQHGDEADVMNAPLTCHHDYESDCKGQTPLITAVMKKRTDIIEALAAAPKLNVNATDFSGKTALIHAVIYCPTMISTLLKLKDIDINAHDLDKKTALHYACLRRNPHEEALPPYVKLLLDVPEINPDPDDKQGWTPLMFAIKRGDAFMEHALQRAIAAREESSNDSVDATMSHTK